MRDFPLVQKSKPIVHSRSGEPEIRGIRVPVKVADNRPLGRIRVRVFFYQFGDIAHKIKWLIDIVPQGDGSRFYGLAHMLAVKPFFRLEDGDHSISRKYFYYIR